MNPFEIDAKNIRYLKCINDCSDSHLFLENDEVHAKREDT